jgi:hypothetical protein
MQSEEDRIVMHVLHTKQGWPIARIAEEFGVSWRTAHRYATTDDASTYGPRAYPARPNEAQLAHLRRRLAACPDLRATTLLRELRDLGYVGSYPTPVRVVRELRPEREHTDPVIRFETDQRQGQELPDASTRGSDRAEKGEGYALTGSALFVIIVVQFS